MLLLTVGGNGDTYARELAEMLAGETATTMAIPTTTETIKEEEEELIGRKEESIGEEGYEDRDQRWWRVLCRW